MMEIRWWIMDHQQRVLAELSARSDAQARERFAEEHPGRPREKLIVRPVPAEAKPIRHLQGSAPPGWIVGDKVRPDGAMPADLLFATPGDTVACQIGPPTEGRYILRCDGVVERPMPYSTDLTLRTAYYTVTKSTLSAVGPATAEIGSLVLVDGTRPD